MNIELVKPGLALLLGLALVPLTAGWAQRPSVPRPEDAVLQNMLPPGQTLETRADGDLNGDGQADVAFVGRSEEDRALYVAFAYRDQFDFGHEIRAKGPLDSYPLGPATLSVARGVLTVEDLTGGTTAVSSTYRLRFDARRKRMRLIGLDMTSYSRTYAHDGTELSWNLLTGDTIRRDLKVVAGGGGYDNGPERRVKQVVKAIYLENLPDSEATAELLARR